MTAAQAALNLRIDPKLSAVASLGSGSKGNGTLVQIGGQRLLVDCGFGLRATSERLGRLGLRPGDLDAILVSHEHADHVQGVARLAHRFDIPVYASHGTLKAQEGKLYGQAVSSDQPFQIANVEVLPVTVPHDAREPTQFIFSADDVRIGVLSDLGHATPHVTQAFQQLDALLLEANHDPGLLAAGSYPPSVKRRVGGKLGHLANQQAANLLASLAHPGLNVLIGHISEQNNRHDLLQALFEPLRPQIASLGYATQGEGHEWLPIGASTAPALAWA